MMQYCKTAFSDYAIFNEKNVVENRGWIQVDKDLSLVDKKNHIIHQSQYHTPPSPYDPHHPDIGGQPLCEPSEPPHFVRHGSVGSSDGDI